jgi:hypothetical protein
MERPTNEASAPTVLLRGAGTSSRALLGRLERLTGTLSPETLAESVTRLRALAFLYAFTYLLAAYAPPVFFPAERGRFFADSSRWLPGLLSIAAALVVAGITYLPSLRDLAKVRFGLLFEVLGSYGIAAAEYQHITAPIDYTMGAGGFGLSWVTAWVLLYTMLVPSPPRVAAVAALASLSSIPVVFAVNAALGTNTVQLGPSQFFLALIFPNLLVAMMAYVGARVVYGLGKAIAEARELGSYRLEQRLGVGGMGEVWRARHRMLTRPAAVKLIRPALFGAKNPESRDVMLKRFEREAQATALMRSPHTTQIYDFGIADDGTFFYVMELLDGLDLDVLVTRFGPLPAERVVHLLAQLCDSLGEAHEAGLIHRDVKPANIYACRYGRAVDFVKVLDFGLVTHREGAAGGEKLTAEHVTGGTPAFMSPEQVLGKGEVDGRSDLYAVGCVAYWLLTGDLVFRGRTPMETMVMHARHDAPPPSRRTELPIPPALDALVLACLAKDPSERPNTAEELAERLATIRLTQRWTAERAREWWNRHQPQVAAPVAPPLM